VAAAVAILAAIVAAGVAYRVTRAPAAPEYETARVDRGRIVAQVTATGTLSALVTVQVGSQVSGRIQKLFADFNTPVKKGQLIAKIDPQLFQAALDQARANHAAARGDLTRARVQAADADRQLSRARSLAERKLIAQADLDTAQAPADAAHAGVEAAAGKVEQARAALQQAEVNLAYTSILSPIDGTVISRSVDVGQTVAASLQAPTLFVIAEDLRKMQVDTSVAEADIGKLRAGMEASFTVDAFPGRRFQGTVRQIRNAPQTVQNVVTYDAVVSVDNSSLKLRPGMTADVSFLVEELPDTLLVPNAALRFRPPGAAEPAAAGSPGDAGGAASARSGGAPAASSRRSQGGASDPTSPRGSRRVVWVASDGQALRAVQVQVGPSDGKSTAIVGGELAVGDRVVTGIAGAPSSQPQGSGTSGQNRGGRPGFGRFL
jgi:HlyD family secretion protein